MKWYEILWDKIKTLWRFLLESINKTLNAAFPQTERKVAFLCLTGACELFLAYMVAVLDNGMWNGDCTIPGMVALYWMQGRSYPFGTYLLLSAVLLAFLYSRLTKIAGGDTGRGFEISDSNVYGSARDINLEELHEVADIVPKEEALNTILGQLDKSEKRLICNKQISNSNNNAIYFGPPGSGKTFTAVLNYIMQAIRRGESVITTDTKGEVFAKTVEAARMHGYIVRRFDIKSPECSDGWNILGELRMDDIRAMLLAEIIMANSSKESHDNDPHAAAEEALLTALCLYVAYNRAIPEDEKTLYNAYAMLGEGVEALDMKFNAIKFDSDMRMAYDAYATAFKNGSPNLRGNVVSNLSNRLRILSNPAIKEMTSQPDIDLTLLGQKPCIYYVEMPDQHRFGKFLASLFFSYAFLDLCEYADARLDQRLPVPVNVMLEETYAVGKLPTITNALATVRSRDISITMIVQGLSQLLEMYGPNMTESILECCGTYICLSSNTRTTSELFEWLAGNATVKVKTEQHQHGEMPLRYGKNYSTGDGRQALYSSNDVRKIKRGRLLIVWQRYDPIMAYTFGIDRHIEYLKGRMPKIHANTHIPLRDKEARAFLRAMEDTRVAEYEAWIAEGGNPWTDYKTPKPKFDGPARNTPPPAIIPYPELEQMALQRSEQAATEKASALLKEIQDLKPVPPADGCEPYALPDDFEWTVNELEGEDADTAEEEAPDMTPQSITETSPEAEPPVVLKKPRKKAKREPAEEPKSLAEDLYNLPDDAQYHRFVEESGKVPEKAFGNVKKIPKPQNRQQKKEPETNCDTQEQ